MAAAVKLSQQPRTESCVVPGTEDLDVTPGGHCQRKVHYFTRSPASYFGVIDFLRLFRINSSGSTAI
jgi:hypothetical protein